MTAWSGSADIRLPPGGALVDPSGANNEIIRDTGRETDRADGLLRFHHVKVEIEGALAGRARFLFLDIRRTLDCHVACGWFDVAAAQFWRGIGVGGMACETSRAAA